MIEQFTSTLTSKSQTVIPKEVRQRMGLKAGDSVRYVVKGRKVEIEKVTAGDGFDPFATFTEWYSEADANAFDGLKPRKH